MAKFAERKWRQSGGKKGRTSARKSGNWGKRRRTKMQIFALALFAEITLKGNKKKTAHFAIQLFMQFSHIFSFCKIRMPMKNSLCSQSSHRWKPIWAASVAGVAGILSNPITKDYFSTQKMTSLCPHPTAPAVCLLKPASRPFVPHCTICDAQTPALTWCCCWRWWWHC